MLTRRNILAIGATTAAAAPWLACRSDGAKPGPNPNPDAGGNPDAGANADATPDSSPTPREPGEPQLTWLGDARVGGFETHSDTPDSEIDSHLDALKASHTNVVIIDSDLSFYMDDVVFEEDALYIDKVARGCHARGMKVLAYYPMLEVLTEDAEQAASTMFKDHPGWVQVGIDGKPNMFIGGEGRVFWVPPGVESAWMCPTSDYVGYFTARVKRLAQTALDGVWGDVPLLSDIVGVWPCTNASCAAKFRADTGFEQPTTVDWESPAFRRWVIWRHRLIHDLEQTVLAAARSVRADFELVVETVTMDYAAATGQGLDGASHDAGDVRRVWEIDAVSDATSMREATIDDWISMAAMMRHGRGCAGWTAPAPAASSPEPTPVPTWAIVYGKEADDAEPVMALAVTAAVCPYETRIPVLNASVGQAYRSRMYGWLQQNRDLWSGESGNAVAVLYSSASRDFLDRNSGVGLYTSFNAADPLWWSTTATDSAKQLPYVGEYRGICKALMHAHAPYDVVIAPHISAAKLAHYPLVIAPQLVALSHAEIAALVAYVKAGGTLLVTGPDAGIYDENGARRATPALLDALALGAETPTPWSRVSLGRGFVVSVEDPPGHRLFNQEPADVMAQLAQLLDLTQRQLVTNAPGPMVFDVRKRAETRLNLLCANLGGLGVQPFAQAPVTFRAQLNTGGRSARKATVSAPGDGGTVTEIPTTLEGRNVTFDLSVAALALVRIDLA